MFCTTQDHALQNHCNLRNVSFQTHVLPNYILNSTLHFSPFSSHVCIMVPHCVETELLPYIRVHYSQPEYSTYGKVCMGFVLIETIITIKRHREYILLHLEITKTLPVSKSNPVEDCGEKFN